MCLALGLLSRKARPFYSAFATLRPSAPVRTAPARGTKSEAAVLGRCARPQPGEPRPQDPIGKDPLGTGQERAEKGQDPQRSVSARRRGCRHFRKHSEARIPFRVHPSLPNPPRQLASKHCGAPAGLFTHRRSSAPVSWCIHGPRRTRCRTLESKRRAFSEAPTARDPVEGKGVLGTVGAGLCQCASLNSSVSNELRV